MELIQGQTKEHKSKGIGARTMINKSNKFSELIDTQLPYTISHTHTDEVQFRRTFLSNTQSIQTSGGCVSQQ